MAVTTLYFDVSGNGLADGTTWDTRAPLLTAGNWSPLITSFDFSTGLTSLKCLIGPGTYTISSTLGTSSFTNAPTVSSVLVLHGCDNNGNQLEPPDPNWTSAEPVWDDSDLPVIAATTNITIFNVGNLIARLLKLTSSARTSAVITAGAACDWLVVENTYSHSSTAGIGSVENVTNCCVKMMGADYSYGVNVFIADNTRVEGLSGGSSGARAGFLIGSASSVISGCTSFNNGGSGIAHSTGSASQQMYIRNCVIYNNASHGIECTSVANQTEVQTYTGNIIVNNGGFGINTFNASHVLPINNRLRDNDSGNFNGLDSFPTDISNITSAGTDSDEFVNPSSGNFQIKNTSSLWGKGYGVSDEAASGSGSEHSYAFVN